MTVLSVVTADGIYGFQVQEPMFIPRMGERVELKEEREVIKVKYVYGEPCMVYVCLGEVK